MPEQIKSLGSETPAEDQQARPPQVNPILPGLLFAVILGAISWFLGGWLPRLGGVTIAILLGITLGNLFPGTARFNQGARVAEKQILPIAIGLLGVELQLASLASLGPSAAFVILMTLLTSFGTSLLLGPHLGYSREFSLLIGAGNGICGSSAVAATSQAINAKETDIGISISIVNLLGTLGIFLVPTIARLFSFGIAESGLLVGGSLQAVGQVVAAGNILGDDVGLVAIAVKMGRILMLGPIVVLLGYLSQRNRKSAPSRKPRIGIPLFILGFFALSLLGSFGVLPTVAIAAISLVGKLLLIVAMAGIGLRIHFRALVQSAPRALMFGALVSVLQIIVLIVTVNLVTV
jgi:uncharacterized integral membrane protein (TIGR00698 family)